MFAARNHILTPAAAGQPVGLSSVLLTFSGTNSAWNQQTIDISAFRGNTVKVVFQYTSGSSFTGDIQLDDISIGGTTFDFETSTGNFETTIAGIAGETFTYTGITWNLVGNSTSSGRWNRDAGGTGSTGTGLAVDHTLGTAAGYYLYAETSGVGSGGTEFWLRSIDIALGASPGNLTFWEAREGATIGTCNVYLDVIS